MNESGKRKNMILHW